MEITLAVVLVLLALLTLAYLFAIRGRRNHLGMAALRGWRYAHRGLHGPGKPENSMAAFRAALEGGYGIELDVRLLADGGLGILHDSDLRRTAGKMVRLEDLTTSQLADYRLEGTHETVPTFGQVLSLFQGKAPMIIELKTADNNYAALTEAVCRALEGYEGPYCLESFDPRCLAWLRKNRPDLIRGQLSMNFMGDKNLPWFLRVSQTYLLSNCLTVPDFVAYDYQGRKCLSNRLCQKLWGVQGVSWTLQTPEQLAAAESEGCLPIFENFTP